MHCDFLFYRAPYKYFYLLTIATATAATATTTIIIPQAVINAR